MKKLLSIAALGIIVLFLSFGSFFIDTVKAGVLLIGTPSKTQTPTPTKTLTPTPTAISVNFSRSNMNSVLPVDILQEVTFYGGGGGVICIPTNKYKVPEISAPPLDEELMHLSSLVVCGWQKGETVTGKIRYPDGRIVTKNIPLKTNEGSYYAELGFRPSLYDPVGTYTFTLEGKSGKVVDAAYFRKPIGPRISKLNESQILAYGFKPNETIRLIYYRPGGKFAGWKQFRVSSNGQLLIQFTAEKFSLLVAMGDKSGEAFMPWEDMWGRTKTDYLTEEKSIKQVCTLKTRLSINKSGRVAYTDGENMRLRTQPGLAQPISNRVPEGTGFIALEGPVCANGIYWWKVRTDNGLQGWMAEYQGSTYLIEPMP